MKKKLRIIVVSIITLILAIIVTICAIVVQNKPSENVPEAVNLTESTTGTESKIYGTETTTNETTIGETTFVEKIAIEETTTKKELAISSATTTKIAEITTKEPKQETSKAVENKSVLPDYLPDYNALNMFDKVNDYRAQSGINKMTLDEELCKMAYIRAKEQAVKKGHERPDGRRFLSIANDYNYDCTYLGENIARGTYNASDQLFVMWQESASHNKNMLNEKWTHSGMAFYKTDAGMFVYVQLFAC